MIIGQRPSTGARRLCTRLECQGRQRTDVRTCTGTNGQTEATRTHCDGLRLKPLLSLSLSLTLRSPCSSFLLLVRSSGTVQAIAIHRHASSLIFQPVALLLSPSALASSHFSRCLLPSLLPSSRSTPSSAPSNFTLSYACLSLTPANPPYPPRGRCFINNKANARGG